MSFRLKKNRAALAERLKSGQAVLKQDKDSVILTEMRPNKFPALVMRFWDKDDFLDD